MARTTWHKIDDKMTALKPLHNRMDRTRDLAYMVPFHLRDFKDEHDLDNVINVTGNPPAVFAHAVISDLMTATWQTVIEGDISSRQAHDIEQFIEDNFAQADEFLLNKFGITSLYAWLCNHVAIRSLIGVRWLSLIEDNQYKIDCLPTDMRWTPFQFGKEGLKWIAPITFRSKEDMEEEFPLKEYPLAVFSGGASSGAHSTKGRFSSGNNLEVRDYWNDEINELWVDKKKITFQDNTLKKPPFVIVLPPAGFMLRDKDYLQHEAEDIFFLNRSLYPEINRALSIEQTLGMDILYPPYEQERENFDGRPSQAAPKSGETLAVRKGERHVPIPRGDLNTASLTSRQDMQKMIEMGGPGISELASASLDRPGIWFARQFEIRIKLLKSRLEALQIMKEGLARLMIEQFIISSEGQSGELLVGRTGSKNRYSASGLGDPDTYTISFRHQVSSKEMEMVNLAQAVAARGTVPMRFIIRDIMKAEDPDGWMRELELEKARETDPAMALAEMAVRYAEEAEDMEDELDADLKKWQSMMLVDNYVRLMRQKMAPPELAQGETEVTEGLEATKPNLQGLASMPKLLSGGGLIGKQPAQEVPSGT